MNNSHQRPTWDEYFMEVAHTIAKRASCDRGRSGCVIARDKQILVTGYVGSPRGLPHCDEVGHLFKQVTHEDGRVTQHTAALIGVGIGALVDLFFMLMFIIKRRYFTSAA